MHMNEMHSLELSRLHKEPGWLFATKATFGYLRLCRGKKISFSLLYSL